MDRKQQTPIRIKILGKNKDQNFKVKNLPIYFGSGKAQNILPIKGEGVTSKHGQLVIKSGRLYYIDISEKGTKVNGTIIKNGKMLLIPGTNEIQIGRNRLLVQNTITPNGSSKFLHSTIRAVKFIFSGIVLISIAFITYMYVIPNVFFKKPIITISNFHLLPNPIKTKNSIYLDRVDFNSNIKIDTSAIDYYVITQNFYGTNDTIVLKDGKTEFVFPSKMLSEEENNRNISLRFLAKSEKYNFTAPLEKEFTLSNEEQIMEKNGIVFTSKVDGIFFTYNIKNNSNNKIKNILAIHGANSGKSYKTDSIIRYVKRSEPYNFLIKVNLENGKQIIFNRKILIEN